MAKRSRVSPELHAYVLERDGMCFMKRIDPEHVCGGYMTVDHVNDGGGKMGKRAPSDAKHLVALCLEANVRGPSREVRQAEREYLASL